MTAGHRTAPACAEMLFEGVKLQAQLRAVFSILWFHHSPGLLLAPSLSLVHSRLCRRAFWSGLRNVWVNWNDIFPSDNGCPWRILLEKCLNLFNSPTTLMPCVAAL